MRHHRLTRRRATRNKINHAFRQPDFFQNLDDDYRTRLIRLLTDRATLHTVIAVSHDPEFLAACDLIIVMENGRIKEQGTFSELLPRFTRAAQHGFTIPVS